MSGTLVLSPHLDDAVLGCGEWLSAHPGCVVVTLFAGLPEISDLTQWDAACGFADSREAMRARVAEDDAALAMLEAQPLRLPFLDAQYCNATDVDQVARACAAVMRRHMPEVVLFPLGLFHSDHILAHEAALRVRASMPGFKWIAYEDALYRRIPGLQRQRIQQLARRGLLALPMPTLRENAHVQAKRFAMMRYASQLRGLGGPGQPGFADALTAEGYWSVHSFSREMAGA